MWTEVDIREDSNLLFIAVPSGESLGGVLLSSGQLEGEQSSATFLKGISDVIARGSHAQGCIRRAQGTH